jgi:hypothetical protein
MTVAKIFALNSWKGIYQVMLTFTYEQGLLLPLKTNWLTYG